MFRSCRIVTYCASAGIAKVALRSKAFRTRLTLSRAEIVMSNTSNNDNKPNTAPDPGRLVIRGLLWGIAMGIGLAIGGPIGAVIVAGASASTGGDS